MKKNILLLLCVLSLSLNAIAQDKKDKKKTKKDKKEFVDPFIYENEESDDYKREDRELISNGAMPKFDVEQGFQNSKNKKKQQKAFQDRKYFFPTKPNNAWQISIFGGLSTLFGDVDPNLFFNNSPALPGHNFGLGVTKSWSYIFSTRLRYSTYTMFTNDAVASTLTQEQFTYVNERSSGLHGYNPGEQFFHNSRTQGHDLNLDLIFSIGNVKFHKEKTNTIFKIFPFAGMSMYQAFYDHYDANGNVYDYQSLDNLNEFNKKDRAEVLKSLTAMRDGKYETNAEDNSFEDENKFLGYNPKFVFGVGGGVTFRLTDWLYLDIETRQTFMRDDLLDGMQWQEPLGSSTLANSKGLTPNFDSYNQTTLGLTFNLVGKKTTEPLTMLNPMHYTYQKLGESDPQKAIDDLLKDDDKDGVPNKLDQEGNTPEGAQVNTKGMALDSDKDGIIDFNDNEPFSEPGYPVDDNGVALNPDLAEQLKKGLGIVDNNGVLGINGPDGKFMPFDKDKSILLKGSSAGGINCEVLPKELPSVHFDKDRYSIKPEFYSSLYEIAHRMMACSDVRVIATGHTDKDDDVKYNDQLSFNRVNKVITYLTTNYPIEKSRFIIKYSGEKNAKATSAAAQYAERKVSFKQVEEETGDSTTKAPHPGMKAGRD